MLHCYCSSAVNKPTCMDNWILITITTSFTSPHLNLSIREVKTCLIFPLAGTLCRCCLGERPSNGGPGSFGRRPRFRLQVATAAVVAADSFCCRLAATWGRHEEAKSKVEERGASGLQSSSAPAHRRSRRRHRRRRFSFSLYGGEGGKCLGLLR